MIIDKGVIEYIEAANALKKEIPNLEFHILGQLDENHKRGISRKTIEKWEQIGAIRWLGQSDDVRTEISLCDCVVLPSYREGTPKTLLEASAMSKPIVTTDVPGCRDVVKDGINGVLCQAMSTRDLAVGMKKIYSLGTDRLVEMGENGRKMVEHAYDEDLVIKKYINHISNIINIKPL